MRQIIAFLLLLLPTWLLSQQSSLLRDKDKDLRQGLELFDKEKFGAAQQYFIKLAEVYPDPHAEIRKHAEYYSAICAVELFNPDAEVLLTQFIYRHPESPLVKQAWFQLGKFFFRDKKYKKALFLVFGLYYYVSKIFRKNRTIPNPVSGQISDDVYPLM
jgi:TolA-binding protein